MFTYADCARMADAIYYLRSAQPDTPEGRQALADTKCTLAGVYENEGALYRAGIWQKAGWSAFCVRGTVPKHWPPTNLEQDVQMKLDDAVPYALLRLAVQDIEAHIHPKSGQRWIVVGHSLGGSVAQVLGFLYGVPFVTFDAPGMRYDVMRRGWAKAVARGVGGLGSEVLSITPGIRSLYDWSVKKTPMLDDSYDQARANVARAIGEPVSNADSTADHDVGDQLGFNIAHSKDTVHKLLGPPIGADYRFADFVPAPNLVPTQVRVMATPISPAGALLAGALTGSAMDVLRYHDSKALADYIASRNWGGEMPVAATADARGRIHYFAPSYMSAPGWENAQRPTS